MRNGVRAYCAQEGETSVGDSAQVLTPGNCKTVLQPATTGSRAHVAVSVGLAAQLSKPLNHDYLCSSRLLHLLPQPMDLPSGNSFLLSL